MATADLGGLDPRHEGLEIPRNAKVHDHPTRQGQYKALATPNEQPSENGPAPVLWRQLVNHAHCHSQEDQAEKRQGDENCKRPRHTSSLAIKPPDVKEF